MNWIWMDDSTHFSRPKNQRSWQPKLTLKGTNGHNVSTPSSGLLKDGDTWMNPRTLLTHSLTHWLTHSLTPSHWCLQCLHPEQHFYWTIWRLCGEKKNINHGASDCKSSHLKMKREWNHEGCGSLWRQKMREREKEWREEKKPTNLYQGMIN